MEPNEPVWAGGWTPYNQLRTDDQYQQDDQLQHQRDHGSQPEENIQRYGHPGGDDRLQDQHSQKFRHDDSQQPKDRVQHEERLQYSNILRGGNHFQHSERLQLGDQLHQNRDPSEDPFAILPTTRGGMKGVVARGTRGGRGGRGGIVSTRGGTKGSLGTKRKQPQHNDSGSEADDDEMPYIPRRSKTAKRGRGAVASASSTRGGPQSAQSSNAHQRQGQDIDSQDDVAVVSKSKAQKKKRAENIAWTGRRPPKEIHRSRVSLRDRLVKGVLEPQDTGMRVHVQLKAAAKAAALAAAARDPGGVIEIGSESESEDDTFANESTPADHLYLPGALVTDLEACLANRAVAGFQSSEIFVVVYKLGTDIKEINSFTNFLAAVGEGLEKLYNHPEVFAQGEYDDRIEFSKDGAKRVSSIVRQLEARFGPQLRRASVHYTFEDNDDEDGLFTSDDPVFVLQGTYNVTDSGLDIEVRLKDDTVVKITVK